MATAQPPIAEIASPRMLLQRAGSDLAVYCAALLGYLLLVPPQFDADIAGSVIPAYRFFLLVSLLFVVPSAIRGRFRFTWPDLFVVLTVGWICLAMAVTSQPQVALTGSIAHFADVGLAYFFARAAIRDLRDLRMLLILLLPGLLFVGGIMVIEALTSRHIIQGVASRLTGEAIDYGSSPRFGLMRAMGPFVHPILAGIFLASFLPLYWLAGFKWWVRVAGALAAFCGVASVSSAAFLGLVAGAVLLAYNWLAERFVNLTWRLFFVFSGLGLFALQFGTEGGAFSFLVRFASLSAISSYTRILIWRYGSENVAENPWFGIGYNDWDRPLWLGFSVDNYWLLMAMRFGLPVAAMILLMALIAVFVLSRRSAAGRSPNSRAERGVAIALAVFALALVSVSVWHAAQVWFFVLAGIAVSLAYAPKAALPAPNWMFPGHARGGKSAPAE